MRALGIERLCVFGLPPVAFLELARDLGCGFVGIGLSAMRYYDPHLYPDWSLRDDAALRRDTRAALADTGVSIGLVEGFSVRRDVDVADLARDLDIVAALGGRRVAVSSAERDRTRTFDQFARFCDMAAPLEVEVVAEIGVGPIDGWPAACEAASQVGKANFRLMLDTMHFFRFAGGTVADVAAAPAGLIGYVQLCDAPERPAFPTYKEEALHERLSPGGGDLPLRELLQALAPQTPISLEVPQRSRAAAGVGPLERVGACVEAARRLLEAC